MGRVPVVLAESAIQDLVEHLRRAGYEVLGPTMQSGTVVHSSITSIDDLPRGVIDEQGPATYRLRESDDERLFSTLAGPTSLRSLWSPPQRLAWTASAEGGEVSVELPGRAPPLVAVLGVRACDLYATAILDRVRLGGAHRDSDYSARRSAAFLIGVECSWSAPTCFCASTQTGPALVDELDFDIALTEVVDAGGHWFLARAGSDRGAAALGAIPHDPASQAEIDVAAEEAAVAAAGQTRSIEQSGLPELLEAAVEDEHWSVVADRCLSCGNCTMVCPTCFCESTREIVALDGSRFEHWQEADTCFSLDHSYMHGGSVRSTTRDRYRQWLTHKFGTWVAQFGTSGCVGCGRCITWCPPGIDVTEELRSLRAAEERAS